MHQLAHEYLRQRRAGCARQRDHRAQAFLIAHFTAKGQARRQHDDDAEQAQHHHGQAKQPYVFAKEHGGKDHGQQRCGIAQGRDLGERQQGQRPETQPHGGGADDAAIEMPHGPKSPQADTQFVPKRQPDQNDRNGEQRAEKHLLPRRHAKPPVGGCLDDRSHDGEHQHAEAF